jgi:hypothetical protein
MISRIVMNDALSFLYFILYIVRQLRIYTYV